ncbi:hypothetical protein RI054_20g88880 [Pseudoscourfieldia marina]
MAFSPKPRSAIQQYTFRLLRLGLHSASTERIVLAFFLVVIALRMVLMPTVPGSGSSSNDFGNDNNAGRRLAPRPLARRKAANQYETPDFQTLAINKLEQLRRQNQMARNQEEVRIHKNVDDTARRIIEDAKREESQGLLSYDVRSADDPVERALANHATKKRAARKTAQLRMTADGGWSINKLGIDPENEKATNAVLEGARKVKQELVAEVQKNERENKQFANVDALDDGTADMPQLADEEEQEGEEEEEEEEEEDGLSSNLALVLGAGTVEAASGNKLMDVTEDGTMKFLDKSSGKMLRKAERNVNSFARSAKRGSDVMVGGGTPPPRNHRVSLAEKMAMSGKKVSGSFSTSEIQTSVLGKPPASVLALMAKAAPGEAKSQAGNEAAAAQQSSSTKLKPSFVFGESEDAGGKSKHPHALREKFLSAAARAAAT